MSSSLLDLIDSEIERKSLLKHTFYGMWSNGELSHEHLAGYAKEYFQLVKIVPELVKNVLAKSPSSQLSFQIRANLKEEEQHIALWKRFSSSLGISQSEIDSYACARDTKIALDKLRKATSASFEEGVAAMYAYEKDIPKISAAKLNGLREFYGLCSQDARAYFEAHEEADVRHAALWRAILSSETSLVQEKKLYLAASKSLEAQNELLDSVLKKYVR